MLLSVLIPCYNEAATIAKMLERLAQITIPMQWIAVDDCSQDATYEVLQQLTTIYPHMQVVRHSHNRGKGAAIRTALTLSLIHI